MITKGIPVVITTDELKKFVDHATDDEWYETNYDAISGVDAKLIFDALRLAYVRGKNEGIQSVISVLL